MRLLFILVVSLGSCSALACYLMPMEAARDHGTLVDEATSIVLLKSGRVREVVLIESDASAQGKVTGISRNRMQVGR